MFAQIRVESVLHLGNQAGLPPPEHHLIRKTKWAFAWVPGPSWQFKKPSRQEEFQSPTNWTCMTYLSATYPPVETSYDFIFEIEWRWDAITTQQSRNLNTTNYSLQKSECILPLTVNHTCQGCSHCGAQPVRASAWKHLNLFIRFPLSLR